MDKSKRIVQADQTQMGNMGLTTLEAVHHLLELAMMSCDSEGVYLDQNLVARYVIMDSPTKIQIYGPDHIGCKKGNVLKSTIELDNGGIDGGVGVDGEEMYPDPNYQYKCTFHDLECPYEQILGFTIVEKIMAELWEIGTEGIVVDRNPSGAITVNCIVIAICGLLGIQRHNIYQEYGNLLDIVLEPGRGGGTNLLLEYTEGDFTIEICSDQTYKVHIPGRDGEDGMTLIVV